MLLRSFSEVTMEEMWYNVAASIDEETWMEIDM